MLPENPLKQPFRQSHVEMQKFPWLSHTQTLGKQSRCSEDYYLQALFS